MLSVNSNNNNELSFNLEDIKKFYRAVLETSFKHPHNPMISKLKTGYFLFVENLFDHEKNDKQRIDDVIAQLKVFIHFKAYPPNLVEQMITDIRDGHARLKVLLNGDKDELLKLVAELNEKKDKAEEDNDKVLNATVYSDIVKLRISEIGVNDKQISSAHSDLAYEVNTLQAEIYKLDEESLEQEVFLRQQIISKLKHFPYKNATDEIRLINEYLLLAYLKTKILKKNQLLQANVDNLEKIIEIYKKVEERSRIGFLSFKAIDLQNLIFCCHQAINFYTKTMLANANNKLAKLRIKQLSTKLVSLYIFVASYSKNINAVLNIKKKIDFIIQNRFISSKVKRDLFKICDAKIFEMIRKIAKECIIQELYEAACENYFLIIQYTQENNLDFKTLLGFGDELLQVYSMLIRDASARIEAILHQSTLKDELTPNSQTQAMMKQVHQFGGKVFAYINELACETKEEFDAKKTMYEKFKEYTLLSSKQEKRLAMQGDSNNNTVYCSSTLFSSSSESDSDSSTNSNSNESSDDENESSSSIQFTSAPASDNEQ